MKSESHAQYDRKVLTLEECLQIKEIFIDDKNIFRKKNVLDKEIAYMFGVSDVTISRIRRGKHKINEKIGTWEDWIKEKKEQ